MPACSMDDPLNAAQYAAVKTLSGPLLVLAGAGTGKTRVVTHRIAELIRRGTRPARILAVTFTRKAADEMQRRATALIARKLKEKPEISTFHALCVRILRRQATRLGYPAGFAIYDRGDSESVARGALREIKVPEAVLRAGELLYFISRWKMGAITPEKAAGLAGSDKEHAASIAFRRYQETLRRSGAMDFDDLLVLAEDLLDRFPDARAAEAGRFTHLLVDEYQDTNACQYRIVKALAREHRNLCVVGDDDQAIYGWRGAEVEHILRFQQDWPDAKVVRLEENYRSTEAILELAGRLIRHNPKRHDKLLRAARGGGEKPRILQCQDAEDEARIVVEDLCARLTADAAQPREFAILFRTNEQSRPFEAELRKARIPYVVVGGQSFFDRKEVRDVLAYLKLLVAPHDEIALRRVINNPPRGIGRGAQEALIAHAVAAGKPLWEVLSAAGDVDEVGSSAVEGALALIGLIEDSRRRLGRDSLVKVAMNVIHGVRYQDELKRLYPDPLEQQARWAAVEEVINMLAAYERRDKRATLAGFLDEAALGDRDDDDREARLNRNAVALLTLHSAKGLEFPHVYLVGMEDGLLPHHKSLETDGADVDEERRLCYVGITRARDRLTISLALARMKWGKPRPTKPSRFLFELTGQADKLDRNGKGKRRARRRPRSGSSARTSPRVK